MLNAHPVQHGILNVLFRNLIPLMPKEKPVRPISKVSRLLPIHEMAYNTEGAFAGEETDIIIKAIQLKTVNHGASVIRGEIIASGANPQMKETIRRSLAYNRQLLNGRTLPSMEVRHLGRPVLGNYTSLKELCEAQNLDLRHTRRILNLRFLAGDILQKILTDRAPTHWTMGALFEASLISDWTEQRALLNR